MRPSRVLLPLALATLACAHAPPRRLPIVDEMPPAPARASATSPAGDFMAFFAGVPAMLPVRPDLSRYAVECSEPLPGGYFTLALRDDGKSALFVFTDSRVTALRGAIAFSVGERGSMDWGFAYDRNGDGWADYLACLEGLHPVETPEVAAQVPARPRPVVVEAQEDPTAHVTDAEAKLMWAHAQLVFVHCADDDFDGAVDALVSAIHDPERWGWIRQHAALRSRTGSQVADEDWVFLTDIAVRQGPVPRDAEGRMVKVLGFTRRDRNVLATATAWLGSVNAGLRACRIPRGTLPSE